MAVRQRRLVRQEVLDDVLGGDGGAEVAKLLGSSLKAVQDKITPAEPAVIMGLHACAMLWPDVAGAHESW